MRILELLNDGATAAICLAIRGYKRFVSPLIGRHCRFEPTCSDYFRMAVEKHGPWRGVVRGISRICRCHPWHPGGYDPP